MSKSLKNKNRNKRSEGGRRKSGKTRKCSPWTKKVTELYRKMKKEDSKASFRDALKKASEMKKKGQL
jgi:hypothetical protein